MNISDQIQERIDRIEMYDDNYIDEEWCHWLRKIKTEVDKLETEREQSIAHASNMYEEGEHWSGPGGCHPECPECRLDLTREEENE